MPAFPRKTQRVIGSGLSVPGNVAQWGSTQAGTPVYSGDLDVLQALDNFLNGLNGMIVGNRSPVMEELTGAFLVITQQLAYTLQAGIPEWDTSTEYFIGGFCRVGFEVYVSLSDGNAGNDPTTDTNNWQPYRDRVAPAKTIAKAWVNFNGNNGTILASQNVTSVVRTAAGCYTITFTVPMADALYAVVATAGPANGGSRSAPAGNNNHISRDTTTTVNAVSVWIPKPDQLYGEDADLVSVQVFGN